MRNREKGFSLIELLVVLAIIGVLAGIGIPSYMGQRKRARMIGQAQVDANLISMQLETIRADTGTYGTVGSYTAGSNLIPAFKPQGSMNYTIAIAGSGQTYLITAKEGTKTFLTQDHNGVVTKYK